MLGSIDHIVMGYFGYGCVKWFGYSFLADRIHHEYEKEASRPAVMDAENRITEDRDCLQCGYNLRTLEASAMCPECGALVCTSIGGNDAGPPLQSMVGRSPSAFVGLVRTLIGVGLGIAYFHLIGSWLKPSGGAVVFQMFVGLVPVRIFEWWLLIWLFYDRKLTNRSLGWGVVFWGVIWSFVLDVPAIFVFLVTGRIVGIC